MEDKDGEGLSSYGFYPLDPTAKALVNDAYQMLCIDEPYNIYGDFDSRAAANLMVTFEVCNEMERKCKSRNEIKNALAYSYILIVENEEFFVQHLTPDDGEMIQRTTKSSWYGLSTIDRSDYVRKIMVESIHFKYYNIGLGLDEEQIEEIHHCENERVREMSYTISI